MSLGPFLRPGSQQSETQAEPPQARAPAPEPTPTPVAGGDDNDLEQGDEGGTVTVTFFDNYAAATKREQCLTLGELAQRIHITSAPDKASLPWLKLARFGETRSDKGSLRHNDNVVAVTGIEADYDRGEMNLADAKDVIGGSGITAIIYPSPSYTPDGPKWRVLCPFSQEYPPTERDRFMARLSGLFGGIFARESWALSQGYYFGRVANPDHHATIFNGTPIDLANHLDTNAINRPKERSVGHQPHPTSKPEDITESRVRGVVNALLDNIRNAPDGEKHHTLRNTCLALGGYLHLTDWSPEEAVEQAVGALPSADDWDQARETATWGIEHGMEKPLELEERPRTRGNGIDHDAAGVAEADAKPPPDWEVAHPPSDEDGSRTRGQIWPEPVDCFTTYDTSPATASEHDVPTALWPFIEDTAERMGVATSSVALATIVACSAVCSDNWRLQPKRSDYTWTENPRLWGAIVRSC